MLEPGDVIAAIAGSVIAEAIRKTDPKNPPMPRQRITNVAAGLACPAFLANTLIAYANFQNYRESVIFGLGWFGAAALNLCSSVMNDAKKLKKIPVIGKFVPDDEEPKDTPKV